MNINEAIFIMRHEVQDKNARAYLEDIDESVSEYGTIGLATQLNYVMCNLATWKGQTAREVKAFVKTWVKEAMKTCHQA